jgi:hypothetical protein
MAIDWKTVGLLSLGFVLVGMVRHKKSQPAWRVTDQPPKRKSSPVARGIVRHEASVSSGLGSTARGALAEIDEKLKDIYFRKVTLNKQVTDTRKHRNALMREYGLTITPSQVEMRSKYPTLYHTEDVLAKGERDLNWLDVRAVQLRKRRDELTE